MLMWISRRQRSLVYVILALAIAAGSPAAAAPRPVNDNLTVEELETPLQRRRMTRAYVYKDPEEGHLRLFMSLAAANGLVGDPRAAAMGADARLLLIDFNLETKRIYSALGPMCGGVNVHLHSKNGMVYFMTGRYTSLNEFDPATGNVRAIGRMTDHYFDAHFNTIEDEDGVMYMGVYGGHAIRYDPRTDRLEDLGLMGNQTNTYLTTVAVKKPWLYSMPWAFGSGGAVVYNLETGEQKHYFPNKEGLPTGQAGNLWLGADGEVYFQKPGLGHFQFIDGEPIKLAGRPDAQPVEVGPRECANVWNPNQAERELGLELDLSGIDPNNFNDGAVTIRWRRKAAEGEEAAEWQELSHKGVDLFPNTPSAADITSDGKLIGVGASYGPVFEFDPETGESKLIGPNPGSVYDVLVEGDMVYMSGYSSMLAVYDRTKPYTLSATNREFGNRNINPFITGAAKRATHMVTAVDGRLYCGGNHSRHTTGAQVVIFDPQTYDVENLRGEVEEYLFRDMAAVDNGDLVVIAAGAPAADRDEGQADRGGDRRGALIVYNVAERKIDRIIELPLDVAHAGNIFPGDGVSVLGLVKLDPRDEHGKQHFKSLLYKYDIAADRLVFSEEITGKAFNGPSFFDYQSNHRRFSLGPDGCGWLFIDFDLTRIHPDGTVETVLRMDVPGQILFLGNDILLYNGGRQSWGGFSNIRRIKNIYR